MSNRASILKQKFLQSTGLPFREVLPESVIEKELKAEGVKYYNSLYNPVVTLWAFVSQVLDPDHQFNLTQTKNNKDQIMRHPFELNLSELKEIDFEIEEISNETAEKVAGGSDFVSLSLEEKGGPPTKGCGEDGGGIIVLPPNF